MAFLEVSGISKSKEGKGDILRDISFTQNQFQKIAIAGETGSGKSTLLKIVAGLVQPDTGQVFLAGDRVLGPEEQLVAGHPEIAYLSQHFELPEFLRVEQALRYANNLTPEEAGTLYEICQISHLLTRRTDELSGGEKQRIALARLLSTSPSLLLLDEPFSNLDSAHKNDLKAVIRDLGEQLEITCLLISHDPLDTLSWAEEILVMHAGQMVQKGTPQQIYHQPKNEYVAGLFGKFNLISPAQAATIPALATHCQNGKSLFLRPEDIAIGTSSGFPGKVGQVNYFGSYYELEVVVGGATLTIKTTEKGLAKGAKVFLHLHEEQVWCL